MAQFLFTNKLNDINEHTSPIQRLTALDQGVGYEVLDLKRIPTRFGQVIVATVQARGKESLKVFLPSRFNQGLTDQDIEDYNDQQHWSLFLIYRGIVGGRHEVQFS